MTIKGHFGRCKGSSTKIGMAGNLRVASELLLRGFDVSTPFVDSGVDLYVNGVVRIQVKAAHIFTKQFSTGQQPCYNFFLARGPKAKGMGISTRSEARVFSDKCDFVILWGIEQSRFWIVPAALLDNRMSIALGPDIRWYDIDGIKLQAMLDAGKDQRAIALELGFSEMTISRRVRNLFTIPSETVAAMKRIKDSEGKWDQIQQYLDTMQEADLVAEQQNVGTAEPH